MNGLCQKCKVAPVFPGFGEEVRSSSLAREQQDFAVRGNPNTLIEWQYRWARNFRSDRLRIYWPSVSEVELAADSICQAWVCSDTYVRPCCFCADLGRKL